MSHHHPSSEEGPGAKIAGLGYKLAAFALSGFVLFWGVALMAGAYTASQPKPAAEEAQPEAAAPAVAAAAEPPAAPVAAPAPAVAPASTPATVATAATADLPGFEEGKNLFATVCAACHQPTGLGLPGMFPPLAGSDWVNTPGAERIIRIVLHGFMGPITINGKPFNSPAPMMPPQGALPDKQIAAVLTYVRNSFGNKAGAVTPEQVKAIRDAEKARTAMWDEASILKIPVTGQP